MYYVGMDIHKKYSSVAVIDEQGVLVDRHRVDHRYREEVTGYSYECIRIFNQSRQGGIVETEIRLIPWILRTIRDRHLNRKTIKWKPCFVDTAVYSRESSISSGWGGGSTHKCPQDLDRVKSLS